MDSNFVQVLFQKTHIEALINNQKQTVKWESYKKDISEVSERLKLFLLKLNVPVLVPIGNKALFRGKLVHTNDIMISLGDGYFVKGSVDQALDVISRRLVKCDEMLKTLEKEKALLESRANIRMNPDLHPSENSKEILEEYVEKEEEAWRMEHRKKVRDYKQKIAKMKEKEPSEIKSDEDLWQRLEILEMEEELNDELDRLGSDQSDSISENDSGSSDENSDNDAHLPIEKAENGSSVKLPLAPIIKRHPSTGQQLDKLEDRNDNEEDFIKIHFKHTSGTSVTPLNSDIINSPGDIYLKFDKNKSRRVSFAETAEVIPFKCEPPIYSVDNKVADSAPVAFGDVMERTVPTELKIDESRPKSRFKLARTHRNLHDLP